MNIQAVIAEEIRFALTVWFERDGIFSLNPYIWVNGSQTRVYLNKLEKRFGYITIDIEGNADYSKAKMFHEGKFVTKKFFSVMVEKNVKEMLLLTKH